MPRVTNAIVAGKIPQNALLDAVDRLRAAEHPGPRDRPDLVPYVWAVPENHVPGASA
jgi:hypothetical protein